MNLPCGELNVIFRIMFNSIETITYSHKISIKAKSLDKQNKTGKKYGQ